MRSEDPDLAEREQGASRREAIIEGEVSPDHSQRPSETFKEARAKKKVKTG